MQLRFPKTSSHFARSQKPHQRTTRPQSENQINPRPNPHPLIFIQHQSTTPYAYLHHLHPPAKQLPQTMGRIKTSQTIDLPSQGQSRRRVKQLHGHSHKQIKIQPRSLLRQKHLQNVHRRQQPLRTQQRSHLQHKNENQSQRLTAHLQKNITPQKQKRIQKQLRRRRQRNHLLLRCLQQVWNRLPAVQRKHRSCLQRLNLTHRLQLHWLLPALLRKE